MPGAGSKPAISTPGDLTAAPPPVFSLPDPATVAAMPPVSIPSPCGRQSLCEPFAATIQAKVEAGLTAQRIYQDLVVEHAFAHSYQAVKRFVRRLRKVLPRRVCRIEVQPGEEAQVDFGLGAPRPPASTETLIVLFALLGQSSRHYPGRIEAMRNWLRKLLGRPTDGRTILLDRVKKAPEIQGALVLNAPPGVAKMSAIIWDFAQPWLEEVTEDEEVRAILGAAITAWNLSLLSPSKCERQFQVLLPKLARRHQIMVRKMITRRRTHFANHQRLVLDYVIECDAHQIHLDVVTTL